MTDMDEAVQESGCARNREESRVSIFIDNNTRLIVQGITGRDGSFHARQMIEYGTHVVGGVTPGKGGQKFDEQGADLQHGRAGGEGNRRERNGHLRSADVRRRRDDGSGGCGNSVHRLHHRRRAGARHDEGLSIRQREGSAAPWTKLSRPHISGQIESRHHPGQDLHAGPDRARQPLGNADIRGGLPDDASRAWVRRLASASEATRSTAPASSIVSRRSRRIRIRTSVVMIGEIGGTDEQEAAAFVKEKMTQAGGRIHRRADRSSGTPDGSRGRDNLRIGGHGGRKDGGVREERNRRRKAADRCRATSQATLTKSLQDNDMAGSRTLTIIKPDAFGVGQGREDHRASRGCWISDCRLAGVAPDPGPGRQLSTRFIRSARSSARSRIS